MGPQSTEGGGGPCSEFAAVVLSVDPGVRM